MVLMANHTSHGQPLRQTIISMNIERCYINLGHMEREHDLSRAEFTYELKLAWKPRRDSQGILSSMLNQCYCLIRLGYFIQKPHIPCGHTEHYWGGCLSCKWLEILWVGVFDKTSHRSINLLGWIYSLNTFLYST